MPNSEGRSILAVPSRLTRPPSRSSSWPSRATRPKAAPPKSGPKPFPTFISSSLNAYLPREIASYTKNLTVSVRMLDRKQVSLVEQAQLQRPAGHQFLDALGAQRRDPLDPLHRAERGDLLARDHPAVAHGDNLAKAKLLPDTLDFRHNRCAVGGIAREHTDGHRAATTIGDKPVVDLKLATLAVAVVTELRERACRALEVARRQIIEGMGPLPKVTFGEFRLNGRLPRKKPIHRGVRVLFVGAFDRQILGEGRGVPPTDRAQFALRIQDPCDHHRDHQIALWGGT